MFTHTFTPPHTCSSHTYYTHTCTHTYTYAHAPHTCSPAPIHTVTPSLIHSYTSTLTHSPHTSTPHIFTLRYARIGMSTHMHPRYTPPHIHTAHKPYKYTRMQAHIQSTPSTCICILTHGLVHICRHMYTHPFTFSPSHTHAHHTHTHTYTHMHAYHRHHPLMHAHAHTQPCSQ